VSAADNFRDNLIRSIKVDKGNLEYIESTGLINGSLFISIRKIMEDYSIFMLKERMDKAIENESELSKLITKVLKDSDNEHLAPELIPIIELIAKEHAKTISKHFIDYLKTLND